MGGVLTHPSEPHGPSAAHLRYSISSPLPRWVTSSGKTLFAGMAFPWRMQRSLCFLNQANSEGIRIMPAPTQSVPRRAGVSGGLGPELKQSQCMHKTNSDNFRFKSLVLCSQEPGLPPSPAWLSTEPEAWAELVVPRSLCPPGWEKRLATLGSLSDERADTTLPCQPFPSHHRPLLPGLPKLCCCR